MFFNFSYFVVFQVVILLVYVLRRQSEEHLFSKLFPTRAHFVVSNLAIVLLAVIYNTERQLFCHPVNWATILLVLSFLSLLIVPFVNLKNQLTSIIVVFNGVGVFISFYLILFARGEYLIFLFFNLPIILGLHFLIKYLNKRFGTNLFNAFYFYPAVLLTPFLLLYESWLLFKSLTNFQSRIFIAPPIIVFVIMIVLAIRIDYLVGEIKKIHNDSQKVMSLINNPVDRYLTELILGAHWKYHTQLCLYDGWRPPYHDPVLVSANKLLHPFSLFDQGVEMESAIDLYKKLYPENKTKFDCRCAKNEWLFDSL